MVYGHFNEKTVTEETLCNPLGIYGTLKYSGELIVKAYHRVFDIPYTIIRPSALYGERCVSRRVGQIFIENAIQKDIKFRNSLKGIIIGQFTLEEYATYIENSSALNKRMMNIVKERLQSNIQLLEEEIAY